MQVAVDCCETLGSSWLFGEPSLPSVCGESPEIDGSCQTGSFAETYDVCGAQGGRMCTAAEALAPSNSGCFYNGQNFWSQTSCADGNGQPGMFAVRGLPSQPITQECRTDLSEVLGVRCCSDVCN